MANDPRVLRRDNALAVAVLSREISIDALRVWCMEHVPPESVEIDEELRLFVVRVPEDLDAATKQFGGPRKNGKKDKKRS